jgi:hypothetical protein
MNQNGKDRTIKKAMALAKKPDPQPVTPPGGATKLHTGAIKASVAGRTDHLPLHVPSGSYVVPADIVSAIGEGNTEHGFSILDHMVKGRASGGSVETGGQPVAVVVAGGEYIIPPDAVAAFGNGNPDAGHAALDAWVKAERATTIATLKKLPGPRRD